MKMERLFRFDMYPADWIVDTTVLTAEECGVYVQIVMMIYAKRGPIPFDPDEISRKLKGLKPRKCEAIILSIIEKGIIYGGLLKRNGDKLTQKRVENELNSKSNHLENSSKGGKNGGGHNKKIKDLGASEPPQPLASPSPSPNPSPSPIAIEDQDPPKQNRVKIPPIGLGSFDVMNMLDDDGFADARDFAAALGQSVDHLAKTYNEAVKNGTLDPPRNANKAFPAWITSIIKRQQGQKR